MSKKRKVLEKENQNNTNCIDSCCGFWWCSCLYRIDCPNFWNPNNVGGYFNCKTKYRTCLRSPIIKSSETSGLPSKAIIVSSESVGFNIESNHLMLFPGLNDSKVGFSVLGHMSFLASFLPGQLSQSHDRIQKVGKIRKIVCTPDHLFIMGVGEIASTPAALALLPSYTS